MSTTGREREGSGDGGPDAPVRTDALIIGAGPVGLFAVFELGMAGLSCDVVDALAGPGGQCTELYPDKPIYDIPAHPRITGADLIARLEEQIAVFEPRMHFGDRAVSLAPADEGRWRVGMSSGRLFDTPVVVIAAGGGAIEPRRPPIPGLAAYEGRSVFYAVRDRCQFAGHDVVIAGGGDSALDWALELVDTARRVTLLHRRPEFRAAAGSVRRMRELVAAGRMDLVIGQIRGLEGRDGDLAAVIAAREGETLRLPAGRLLLFFGLAGKMGPLAEWGLRMEGGRFVVDPATFETSRPGVFAIGDACVYPGKLKLILSGFHEAALMARRAVALARPGEHHAFMHSTSMDVLKERFGE